MVSAVLVHLTNTPLMDAFYSGSMNTRNGWVHVRVMLHHVENIIAEVCGTEGGVLLVARLSRLQLLCSNWRVCIFEGLCDGELEDN